MDDKRAREIRAIQFRLGWWDEGLKHKCERKYGDDVRALLADRDEQAKEIERLRKALCIAGELHEFNPYPFLVEADREIKASETARAREQAEHEAGSGTPIPDCENCGHLWAHHATGGERCESIGCMCDRYYAPTITHPLDPATGGER